MTRPEGTEIGQTLKWRKDISTDAVPTLTQYRSGNGQWIVQRSRSESAFNAWPWKLYRKSALDSKLHFINSFSTLKRAKATAQETMDVEARTHARKEREWRAKHVSAITGFTPEYLEKLGGF